MSTMAGIQDYMRRNRSPATMALIGLSLSIFVLSWMMNGKLFEPLSFATDWSRPWGILTYPFANGGNGGGLFWFLLELYWLFWVGSVTESEVGTPRFVAFFFAMSVLAALCIWLGMVLIHPGHAAALGGLELAISALTVAWGTRHAHENILLMFIIPVPGWILAWLTAFLVMFGFGSMYAAPVMGLFASVHLILAYLYAANRIPNLAYGRAPAAVREKFLKATEKRDQSYYDDVRKREEERKDRERLRKLFEDSMKDGDSDK